VIKLRVAFIVGFPYSYSIFSNVCTDCFIYKHGSLTVQAIMDVFHK